MELEERLGLHPRMVVTMRTPQPQHRWVSTGLSSWTEVNLTTLFDYADVPTNKRDHLPLNYLIIKVLLRLVRDRTRQQGGV